MPTDTLYGLVGLATNAAAVERIYSLKGRLPQQPSVILIAKIDDLQLFGVKLSPKLRARLEKLWPAKVSVILPVRHNHAHLVQGPLGTHAFRMPADDALRVLIDKTGPLIAPSANLAGEEPAKNLEEAEAYFGGTIDFYVDGGELNNPPSSLVLVERGGGITIKRLGADLDKVKDIFGT